MIRNKARIAVVDDEPSVARLIARLLTLHGYDVWVEPDCARLLAEVEHGSGTVDLLITDQTMPGMTGAELVRAVRALKPSLPVILVTGFAANMTSEEVGNWGNSAYLLKPLDFQELLANVRALLADAPEALSARA